MSQVTHGLLKAAEGFGFFGLLIYAVVKANVELLTLVFIVYELIRIRDILTGNDYEAFLKRQESKETKAT